MNRSVSATPHRESAKAATRQPQKCHIGSHKSSHKDSHKCSPAIIPPHTAGRRALDCEGRRLQRPPSPPSVSRRRVAARGCCFCDALASSLRRRTSSSRRRFVAAESSQRRRLVASSSRRRRGVVAVVGRRRVARCPRRVVVVHPDPPGSRCTQIHPLFGYPGTAPAPRLPGSLSHHHRHVVAASPCRRRIVVAVLPRLYPHLRLHPHPVLSVSSLRRRRRCRAYRF